MIFYFILINCKEQWGTLTLKLLIIYHIKTLVSRLFQFWSQLHKYKNVQNNCPMGLGLQSKQNIINPQSGHCLAWSLLFIHVRILNLFLHPDDVINYFTQKFTAVELDRYIWDVVLLY